MSSADQAIPTALAALNTLYHDPDADAKKRANEWLQEFQHGVRFDHPYATVLIPGRCLADLSCAPQQS